MNFSSRLVSSLEKCFLRSDITQFTELKEEKIFKNQKYSFQLVASFDDNWQVAFKPVIEGDLAPYVTVREVVNIPAEMPTYPHCTPLPKIHEPGLYPDLLRPLKYRGIFRLHPKQSRALWIDIDPKGEITGEHILKIKLYKVNITSKGFTPIDEVAVEHELKIDIKDVEIPEQTLKFTQWFYADCLADYYDVEVFSDRHFEICENYAKKAVEFGRNMLMVPLLTYALDTYGGGERTTTQLIDVYKDGDDYTFGYENLDRWLDMYQRIGVKYYEISPVFSQWGADNTPKVVATVNGEKKTIFGWGTDPLSKEYNTFVRAFLKGFIDHMKERGEDHKCWYHVSDEPITEHFEQYKKVRDSIYDLVEDYETLDAISHYEFYESGLSKNPVPKTMVVHEFFDKGAKDIWTYYCGGQCTDVSNCHFAMELARVRCLGTQMFKYNTQGFLQWGYNYYNNQWSYDRIDPFAVSDAESFAASGDAYMVYPAPDGTPWESTRFRALYEGMEDMRVMQLAEKLCGKEAVIKTIEDIIGEVRFDKCILESDTMLQVRRAVNDLIFNKI